MKEDNQKMINKLFTEFSEDMQNSLFIDLFLDFYERVGSIKYEDFAACVSFYNKNKTKIENTNLLNLYANALINIKINNLDETRIPVYEQTIQKISADLEASLENQKGR